MRKHNLTRIVLGALAIGTLLSQTARTEDNSEIIAPLDLVRKLLMDGSPIDSQKTLQSLPERNISPAPSESRQKANEAAVQAARNATKDFKKVYQKPEQCYDMEDKATRIWCANHFMKAKKDYEKQNQIAIQ
ncbi:MAG: hypothetical protein WC782_06280 [Methylococcaceae bacterium]|jgi:hypothetical protein